MKLWEFLGKHTKAWYVRWTALAGFIYFIYRIFVSLRGFVAQWLQGESFTPVGRAGAVYTVNETAPALIASLVILSSIVLVAFVYTVYCLYKCSRTEGAATAQSMTLIKTFHRTTQAADLISKRLFPGATAGLKKVISCKQIYTLYENGDCHFMEILLLTAKDKEIHFIEKGMDAEPEANPVEFPDEIDLKIQSSTQGKQVAYLINKNEPRSKSVVIFFLPLIKPGIDDSRELKTTFYWKGLFRKLMATGEEGFSYQVRSVEPVAEVEYQFWVKPRMAVLTCHNVGEAFEGGTETLRKAEDQKGMKGWIYKATNVPGSHVTRLRLEAKTG